MRSHFIDRLTADELAVLSAIGERVGAGCGEPCTADTELSDGPERRGYASQSENRLPVSRS